MAESDHDKPPRSLLWAGVEVIALAAVSFAVLAALARSLDPETFGRAATALALVQIACSVVEALFLDAIVQRRDLSAPQRAATHSLSTLVALGLALGLAAWAVTRPGLLRADAVAGLALLMAPSIVLTGATAVPLAMLRRRLAMREVALLCATARIASGTAAIGLLAGGAGVWGLVAHQNLSALLLLLALQARGHAVLSGWGAPAPARALLRFALVNSLYGLLSSNRARLFQLMSALVMPARVVGELALALRLVEMLAAVVVTGMARTALVRLSDWVYSGRDSAAEFLALTRRFAALATPTFVLVAALAAPLVQLVGGRSWLDAAGLVAAFALAQALRSPIHLTGTLFAAHGRPQLNVLLVTIDLLTLAALAVLLRDPMAWVWRLVLMLPLTVWLLQREAAVAALALLRSVGEPFAAALGMGLLLAAALHGVPALAAWPPLAVLAAASAAGAVLYAAMLTLTWRGLWQDMRALARL
jgi:lipopolysaccharide exporter